MNWELKDCKEINMQPFAYAVSLFNGKWKMHILFWHWKKKIMRYSEIKWELGEVTHKMLSTQLKEPERDEWLIRHEYLQVPPKVEFCLSKRGQSLMPILEEICKWGQIIFPPMVQPAKSDNSYSGAAISF